MLHLEDHAAHTRIIVVLDRLVELPQPERPNGVLLILGIANRALLPSHFQLRHRCAPYTISSTLLPRRAATSSAVRSDSRPASVAFTMFTGLFEPSDFDNTSRTPAASSTARTGPPAITPVPGEAGRSMTCAPEKRSFTSCGIVLPTSRTRIMFFFAF